MKKMLLPLMLMLGVLTSCNQTDTQSQDKSECATSYVRPNVAALNTDLNAAKARWAAANISNYSYVQTLNSLVGGTTKVTVRAAQVTATDLVGSPRPYEQGTTVEGLFAQIAQGISQANEPKSCLMVSATYDPQDGHPLTAIFNNNLANVTDTYVSYIFSDFKKE